MTALGRVRAVVVCDPHDDGGGYEVVAGDCIMPGEVIVVCHTRSEANEIARRLATSMRVRCLTLDEESVASDA